MVFFSVLIMRFIHNSILLISASYTLTGCGGNEKEADQVEEISAEDGDESGVLSGDGGGEESRVSSSHESVKQLLNENEEILQSQSEVIKNLKLDLDDSNRVNSDTGNALRKFRSKQDPVVVTNRRDVGSIIDAYLAGIEKKQIAPVGPKRGRSAKGSSSKGGGVDS